MALLEYIFMKNKPVAQCHLSSTRNMEKYLDISHFRGLLAKKVIFR